MTDEQIKTYLKNAISRDLPYYILSPITLNSVLDLINRLQAENRKLQNKVELLELGGKMSKEDSNKSKYYAMEVIKKQEETISRLQAENERLKAEQQMADGYADALVEYTKEKAIKDYKERLIFEIVNTPTRKQEGGLTYLSGVSTRENEIIDIINGLDAKEMVGEE